MGSREALKVEQLIKASAREVVGTRQYCSDDPLKVTAHGKQCTRPPWRSL